MRILYLGLPLGALYLTEHGFAPEALVIDPLDLPGRRRLRSRLGPSGALLLGRPDLGDEVVRQAFEGMRPDVVVSWFYPKRIPEWVIELPSRGAYNVHPSLLPRWRGADPYFWALRAGDTETGVTLHRISSEYDRGPILAQERVVIDPGDNAWRLAKRLDAPALRLLLHAVRSAAAGRELVGSPQTEEGASDAPAPTEDDLVISWRLDTPTILQLIRAASPRPGASAQLQDTVVEVLDAVESRPAELRALEPGEALLDSRGVHVRTNGGGVLLLRVRTESGEELRNAAIARLLEARSLKSS